MSSNDKREPKPPLNIPAGNSPITPEQGVIPEDDRPTGNKLEDYKRALQRVSLDDFNRVSQIPCWRSTFLYAISGGAGIGAIRYLGTRKVFSACQWSVGTGLLIAVGAWEMCNSQRRKELAQMRQIQERFPHRHVSKLKRRGDDGQPAKPSETE